MKRGLASPWVHSALPMTRRRRLQLLRVVYWKSLKRRAGSPVRRLSASACPMCHSISSASRALRGQAEHEVHAICLAPRHQALAREARIAAHQDADPRPARPDPADDARQLDIGSGRPVDVRAPQLGRQQMPAARHVQRQIAVAVVIAVEEPAFLLAVQRIVRRIEVEHDLPRRPPMRLHEQVDQQVLDRRLVVADLVILRRLRAAQLQTVERALARKRRAVRPLRLELAQQHRQQRIMPQMVVIVEILVAQRQAEHPLPTSVRTCVLDQLGIAVIREAAGKPIDQSDRPIRRRPAAIRQRPT